MSWKMPFKVLGYDVGLRFFMLRMTFPIYFGIKDEDVPDLLLIAFAMFVKRVVNSSVDILGLYASRNVFTILRRVKW